MLEPEPKQAPSPGSSAQWHSRRLGAAGQGEVKPRGLKVSKGSPTLGTKVRHS